jgi:tetratricopeptide (TPR) repeat protein
MRANQLDYPDVHVALYELASSQGDEAEMRRQMIWANGKAEVEDVILARQADTEAFHGHVRVAREFSRRAIESARRAEKKETAALWSVYAALRESELGNWHAARQGAAAALAMAPTREVLTVATLILARSGDASRVQKMSDDLARLYPVDTLINGYWQPTIRAAIKLAQNQPAEAIELLQGAVPYDLVAPSGSWTMTLLPAYVRGAGYLRLRRGKDAAVEYQKFIDHQAAVKTFPLGALARLGLARAYSVQGESAKARIAYQEFLTLWKDADPDVPILREAKAEYEKPH